ncbi:MAG: hypothetical protein R3E55_07105 [Burkholderiaceae bacterium]
MYKSICTARCGSSVQSDSSFPPVFYVNAFASVACRSASALEVDLRFDFSDDGQVAFDFGDDSVCSSSGGMELMARLFH